MLLSYILRDVLSDTSSDCCFLCFNTIREIETASNIEDEVCLGIETTEVLYEMIYTVLGEKVLDSISPHNIICQKCTGTVINCYKFIQQCRQNIEQLHCTINSLQECAQNISSENYGCKSLFVVLDTSDWNVDMYYDKQQNINNQTLLLERFQRIYEDSQQCYSDIEVDSNYSSDNKNFAGKRRIEKSSILQSIELADIVLDKPDLEKKRNNLKCKTCLKMYRTPSIMRQHYLRVHAPKDFKCSLCPRSFGSSVILKQHTKDSHSSAVCSQCGKTCNSIHSLRRHVQEHIRSHPACQTCGKLYKTKQALNNHIEKKLCQTTSKSNAEALDTSNCKPDIVLDKLDLNKKINDRKCKACLKLFPAPGIMRAHYLRMHAPKDFKCSLCPRSFGSSVILKQHTKDSHSSAVCSQCGKTYNNIHSLRRHVQEHIRSHPACQTCGKLYKTKQALNNHIEKKLCQTTSKTNAEALDTSNCKPDIVLDKLDLNIKINDRKCKACLKLFPAPGIMRAHYLRMHAPKDFKCSLCPRSFGSSVILKQHTKGSHTTVVCYQCGKTCTKHAIKHHEERHVTSRLICQICGKHFKGKQGLKYHIEMKLCGMMSKTKAEPKFSCDYCGKKYSRKPGLIVHIRLEHENGKAVICDWCGKKFSCISRLKEHIITHTKQKNFECDLCGGKFVTKTSLLYHTRTHTGEKPYKCEICEKTFLSASRRSEHIKRHHTKPSIECDICHGRFKCTGSLIRHRKKHFNARSKLYCDPPDSVNL